MSDKTSSDAGDSSDEKRFHRRGFFSEGFRQFFKPLAEHLADKVSDRLDRAGVHFQDDKSHGTPGGPPSHVPSVEVPDRPVLRPPGAVMEEEFLDRCLSSGQCVNVCPVSAIKLAKSDDPRQDDKPFIDPEMQACVVCEDLACMQACPSGAIELLPREEIRMGLAVLNHEHCVRSFGEDCQICVDKCPLGAEAIHIPYEGATVHVIEEGCTGCGVCQMYCPTDPRAIVIEPAYTDDRDGGPTDYYGDVGDDGSYFPIDDSPADGTD